MLDPKSSIVQPDTDNVHEAVRVHGLIVEVGQHLTDAYPGHIWFVETKAAQQVVHIRLPDLEVMFPQQRNTGAYFKYKTLHGPADVKREAIRAGGLLLEAYNIRRGKHWQGNYEADANPFAGALTASRHHKNIASGKAPLVKITGANGTKPEGDSDPVTVELLQ